MMTALKVIAIVAACFGIVLGGMIGLVSFLSANPQIARQLIVRLEAEAARNEAAVKLYQTLTPRQRILVDDCLDQRKPLVGGPTPETLARCLVLVVGDR